MKNKNAGSFRDFLVYFLRLGTLGFGGPIALANHMQNDLVEEYKWISQDDYREGLAFAQLSPGPLAAQLAMYLGWVRAGRLGATLTGIIFIAPSFLMVVGLAALYLRFGTLPWIQSLFYSVGAAAIGIIAKSAYQLTKKTIGNDLLLRGVFIISAGTTIWTKSEGLWIFLASGVVTTLIKAPPRLNHKSLTVWILPSGLVTGLKGSASIGILTQIIFYFFKVGAVVFGSGLAIVPFLHGGIVQHFHWLNERQFLDAIAVGMITPGPIVITSAFIGYLVAGPLGSIAAALGIFGPAYFFVIILASYYRRFRKNPQLKAFVSGVTSAAVGGIAGAVFVLGERAIIDPNTAIIAILVFSVLVVTKKIPEPIIILLAGGVGLVIKGI